ncbi:HAD family hydrolase [Mucilaginibacter sp. Bleaf8]|uniref:D-glycero-alpha-D-manno-heptose-1,7-bisphosphate 7-phosphatase n=1 Tax=Mucilaginibacter sp. Bleaf8 TaxID=2834430 RepID=UPI001BCE4A17|nr:HAD family hydrolase [Mucilaginibacter sp. Bleaf8]MBS7564693.1 HAD family hydrolase [Mucilaginibacter sp. Bleaf8]
MNKAIFLDKDGTVINDVPYNVNPDLITLKPGVIEGLQQLKAQGYLLVMVTNQAGVAKGYFSEDALPAVEHRLQDLLQPYQLRLDAFYYCPNHPEGTVAPYNIACNYRKPMPGMLLQAAAEFDIDLESSWMIGDILHDVEAGNRAGCRSILIDNGGETEWLKDNEFREPDFVCADMIQAAQYILNQTPDPITCQLLN